MRDDLRGSRPSASDRASQLIAAAADRGLAPLGLVRKGRTRTWIDDHRWWLVNVEFQPSDGRRGCYLNVGEQHLWVVRNYVVLGKVERPLGGATFVHFDGDEAAFVRSMKGVVDAAADSVRERRRDHGDGIDALRRLAMGPDDLDGGIAAAILGETELARSRLGGRVHGSDRSAAESFVGVDRATAELTARAAITLTRAHLGLRSHDSSSW